MAFPIEIALENQHGRQPVPNRPTPIAAHTALQEHPFCRHTGQPLVPGRHRQVERRLERVDKGQHLLGLATRLAIKLEREANDYLPDLFFGDKPGERLQVLAETFALEGRSTLGRQPQVIAEGQPDRPIPNVQGENSREVL